MKDSMSKVRSKRNKKIFQINQIFQSDMMQAHKWKIVSFLEQDKFNKLKGNNLKSIMSLRVYTQDTTLSWNLFGWIT